MPERDFESIYENYSRLVYWAAYRVLSEKEAAEDVTQNVFISVLKNKEVLSDEPVGAEVADTGTTPEEDVLASDTRAAVREALASVDDIYREPLTMYYFSDMSVSEIAEALELSEGTVKSRMSRGRKLMAQHLRAKGIVYE